jgi:WD40 repeat protein
MMIGVCDVKSGGLVLGPLMMQAKGYFLEFSPDGQKIVSASDGGKVCVWDADTGALMSAFSQQYAKGALAVAFTSASHQCVISPDGKWIAAIDRNDKCKTKFGPYSMGYIIRDSETGLVAATLEKDLSHMCTVAFSPDSKQILTAHFDSNTCRVHTNQLN